MTMILLPYMLLGHRTEFITESYVSSPPAAFIVDEYGNTFTLGFNYNLNIQGHYAFNVLFNGNNTFVYASHIERRNGKVRVFTENGYKIWNGRGFV